MKTLFGLPKSGRSDFMAFRSVVALSVEQIKVRHQLVSFPCSATFPGLVRLYFLPTTLADIAIRGICEVAYFWWLGRIELA
jgi:hypothetical protein